MSNISITNNNSGGGGSGVAIQFIEGNDSTPVPPNSTTFILDLLGDSDKGVSVLNTAPYTETISVAFATTSTPGVAFFNPDYFTVVDGEVTPLGTAELSTLTPNDGSPISPVAGNVNDVGLAANSGGDAYPLYSYNGGAGQQNWENRTFLTPYVVDPSTTDGAKGTYATLAAAITAAISDGATGNGVTIFLRNATFNEMITVSTASVNIAIVGLTGKNELNQNSGPIFSGTFTNSGSGSITFNNVNISGTLVNSSSGQIYVNNCVASGTFENTSTGTLGFVQCFGNEPTIVASGGDIGINYCGISGGTITFSNAANMQMFGTNFSGTLAGTTSNIISFNFCYLPLAANNMTGGTLVISGGCSFGAFDWYSNTSVSYGILNSSQGNVLKSVRVSGDYAILAPYDYYVGVTSTASPVAITLPDTQVITNQTFIIKDESGGAGTNNITVSVTGGVKTIDGQSSFVIANNYGSIELIYDGTNFFIL